ncbi:hypothetical protein [Yoonia sp. 2307UL14-13]|uniref:hypothetical protein n=1 Tax=Yoonia sp. 2307UL14-13 TaxID=3126506 RepID=UPI0030B29481
MAIWEKDHVESDDSFCFVLDVDVVANPKLRSDLAPMIISTDRHAVHLGLVSELIEEMDMVRAAVERHVEKIALRNTSQSEKTDIAEISALYLPVREIRPNNNKTDCLGLPFGTLAFIDATGVAYVLISSHLGFRDAIFSAFASLLDIANLANASLQQSGSRQQSNSIRDELYSGLSSHRTDLIFNNRVQSAFRR